MAQDKVKNSPRHKDRGKQVREQAERQGDSKTFDRHRAKDEQDGRSYDGGDVRIDNGDPGMRKALLNCRRRRFTVTYFFADPLEDEHIRIDTHADSEDRSRRRAGRLIRNSG